MEKVKLTKMQAEAIELIRGDANGGCTYGNIKAQLKKQWRRNPYKTLNDLTVEQFLDALLERYEVEETFEVGDWVMLDNGAIGEIIEIEKYLTTGQRYYKVSWWDDVSKSIIESIHLDFERHATPEEIAEEKQRRWWAKHGREEFELKNMDIIVGEYDGYFTVWEIHDGGKNYDIYSHEKRKVERISKSEVKHFRVVCFVEDRKDVDHD